MGQRDAPTHTVCLIASTDLLRLSFCKQLSSPGIDEVIHQLTGKGVVSRVAPATFCFRGLNPCRSGACPAQPQLPPPEPRAASPDKAPGLPGPAPPQWGLRQSPLRGTELMASCPGPRSRAPGSSAPPQCLSCTKFRCAGGKEKTLLKLQGGDYLCLRYTLSLYQVGWVCCSELLGILFYPYHEVFFCFSSSL